MAKDIRTRVKKQFDELSLLALENLGPKIISWYERLASLYLKMLWDTVRDQIPGADVRDEDYEIACWLSVPKFVAEI